MDQTNEFLISSNFINLFNYRYFIKKRINCFFAEVEHNTSLVDLIRYTSFLCLYIFTNDNNIHEV